MDISVHPPRVRTLLSRLFTSGLRAVNPAKAIVRHVSRSRSILQIGEKRYDLRAYDRIMVVGAGKASAVMARALEKIVGSRLTGGLVAVKYGHAVPTRRIEVVEAGHPVPDRSGCRSPVFAIGHPEGLYWTYTEGVISQIRPRYRWEASGYSFRATIVQTQTAVSFGSSGGPLINRNGNLVGIMATVVGERAGFNFAISVHEVKDFLNK